jgi:hypothetical protein
MQARMQILPKEAPMNSPFTQSLARLGGISSIVQAVAYVIAVVAVMFMPLDRITNSTADFAAFYSANPAPITILGLSLVALAVLGLTSVVPATAALLGEVHSGWVTLGRNIAFLSLGVIMVYYTWFLSSVSGYVEAYNSGDRVVQAIISTTDPHVPLNWVGWFIFGGMGLWVAVVGSIVFRTGVLHRRFVLTCVIKTGGFWIALAGITLHHIPLAMVGTVIGALIGGTLYHLWLGIALLQKAARLT